MFLYPLWMKFRWGGGVNKNLCLCRFMSHLYHFLLWHWHTIFDTWLYHQETMCHVHSWSRYNIDLWPQGQIYRIFDKSSCPTCNFCLLWHWHIIFSTWVWCVANIYYPDTTLTFDLKVNFIGILTWLCVWTTAFLSFDIVIPYLAH